MLTWILMGGPLMWLILLSGAIALAALLERALHLHRARIKTADFLRGIANIIAHNNIPEALTICEETPGPVAAIARAAILHYKTDRATVLEAVDRAALTEIGRMEHRATILAAIAYAAPLMGLLGSVLGLIKMLITVQQKAPLLHSGDLAAAVWQALLTSATGLGVGIFAMLAYSLIMSKIDFLALDMEQAAIEITVLASKDSATD